VVHHRVGLVMLFLIKRFIIFINLIINLIQLHEETKTYRLKAGSYLLPELLITSFAKALSLSKQSLTVHLIKNYDQFFLQKKIPLLYVHHSNPVSIWNAGIACPGR